MHTVLHVVDGQAREGELPNIRLGYQSLLFRNKFKAENITNELVTDEVASQAYVEQFGLVTFQRADNAVRANKATRLILNSHPLY